MSRKTITAEETELKKQESVVARKKKVLEEYAEIQQMEYDLGLQEESSSSQTPPNSSGGFPFDFDNPKIAACLEEAADMGTFSVFKMEGGQESKIGLFPIGDWPSRMESLAHSCNGGTFKIIFRRANGTNAGQITQTFDPKFYGKPQNGNGDGGLQSEGLMKILFQTMSDSKKEMVELMKTVLTNQNGNSGMFKTAQDLAVIAQLFKKDSGGDTKALMEALQLGISLGEKMSSGDNGGSDDGIISKVLKSIVEKVGVPAVEKMMQNPQPLSVPVSIPKVIENNPQTAQPRQGGPVMTDIEKIKSSFFYRLYAPAILEAARKNEDVGEWADKIMDRISEEYDGIVYDLVSRPDVVDYLMLFEPEVKNYAAWFTELTNKILDVYNTPEEVPAVVSEDSEQKLEAQAV